MEYHTEDESEEAIVSDSNSDSQINQSLQSKRNKTSYVWKFFRPVQGENGKIVNECIICNACVGNQTSNLARHLITTHSITKPKLGDEKSARLRPSRSFVWKYSTKEGLNHARCHFCNKVLYCGGGNTSNLSKHLRRRHMDLIDDRPENAEEGVEEDADCTTAIIQGEFIEAEVDGEGIETSGETNVYRVYELDSKESTVIENSGVKDRKGSYVWKFCDKLSRHTIRCKLCSKVMSFHGTANVITHLQRRHNIVGPVAKEQNVIVPTDERNLAAEESVGNNLMMRRRSTGTSSIVWKYCKRVSRDAVRCTFCKKNLSYQGTSNLQRHLHRMHGIVTQGRNYKATPSTATDTEVTQIQLSPEVLWEYLEELEDESKAKCKMCETVFDVKDESTISKHLVAAHAVKPPEMAMKRRKLNKSNSEFQDFSDSEDDNGNWSNLGEADNIEVIDEMHMKKDDSFFDEIIEEEYVAPNYDEEPMDPSASQVVIENPLSPQSPQSCAGDLSPDPRNQRNIPYVYRKSGRIQQLNEELLRVETEYFKEKTAFMRMQKYLTVLKAKKVRIELERVHSVPVEYTGPTYSVNVDIPSEELSILPTQ